jgi:glycosyltransferase involved in cell wall biosynthesis
LVFLEASLAGLPCVSYRHGGVPEAVIDGDTGVLADEGDVVGLTRALASILTNPARAAELGARGEARVRSEFDIRTQTAQLERIYDEVRDGARVGSKARRVW